MDRYRLSDADEEPRSGTGTTPHNQLIRSLGLLDILMVGIAAMKIGRASCRERV